MLFCKDSLIMHLCQYCSNIIFLGGGGRNIVIPDMTTGQIYWVVPDNTVYRTHPWKTSGVPRGRGGVMLSLKL